MTLPRRLPILLSLALGLPACAPSEAPKSTTITEGTGVEQGNAPLTRAPKAIATH